VNIGERHEPARIFAPFTAWTHRNSDEPQGQRNVTRVKIIHHRLPLDVAARLAGRAGWLRQLMPVLDAKLPLPYPPLEVYPANLHDEFADGTTMRLFGRVGLRPYTDANTITYTVQITAPALLEFDDNLVQGVLAHEFLHVVADTLKAYEFMQSGATGRYTQQTVAGYDATFD